MSFRDGFSACFLPPTPSFPPKPSDQFLFCVFPLAFLSKNTRHVFFSLHFLLLCSHRLASGVCFSACFSFQKHTTCVFLLTFPLIHTLFFPRSLFSPRPIDKLPEWFFQLAFLFLRPRCGFFRLLSSSLAQFSPRDLSISFQGGFSSLLLSSCAHIVGFSAHFLPPTPSFPPQQINKLPEWVFSLAFLFLRPHRGFFCSLSSFHAHFSPRNPTISFQGGFSRLLLSSYAHVVGFSACHFLSTPTFLPATQQ